MDDSYENADYPIAGYNFIKPLNTNDPSMFICIWLTKTILKIFLAFFFTNLNDASGQISYIFFYFCMTKSLHTSSTVEEN